MALKGEVRFGVAAYLDRSVDVVFGNIEKRATRARDAVNRSLGGVGRGAYRGLESESRRSADRMASDTRRSVAEQTRAVLAVARMRARAEREAAAEHARAERAKVRETERAARERARASTQQLREEARARREETRARREEARARRQEERVQERANAAVRSSFAYRTAYHGIIRYAPSALHRGARVANDMLRGAGVDLNVGSAVARNVALESKVTEIVNQASIGGVDVGRGMVRNRIREVADRYGLDREQTAQSLIDFAKTTGDLPAALSLLDELAKRAAATSTPLLELAAASGEVVAGLGDVPNKGAAVLRVLDAAIGQGAKGAVEISDLASKFAPLAASAGKFGGSTETNMVKMIALAQLARQSGGASSPAEAVTSVARFADQLRVPARVKQFEKHGVRLRDENNMLRDPFEIIKDTIRSVKGDPTELKKMLMSTVGDKPATALLNAYNRAGGGEAGMAAIDQLIAGFMETADVTKKLREGVARTNADTATSTKKFQNAMDDVVGQLQDKLLPKLREAGPDFIKVAKWAADAAAWAVSNPLKALGVVLTASIARAGLESVIRAGIEANLRAAVASWQSAPLGAPGGPAGGATGAGSTVGRAVIAAQSVMLAAAAVTMLGAAGNDLAATVGSDKRLENVFTPGFDNNGEFQGLGAIFRDLLGGTAFKLGDFLGDVTARTIKTLTEEPASGLSGDAYDKAYGRGKYDTRTPNWVETDAPRPAAAPQVANAPMTADQLAGIVDAGKLDPNALQQAVANALRGGPIRVIVDNMPADVPPVFVGDKGRQPPL